MVFSIVLSTNNYEFRKIIYPLAGPAEDSNPVFDQN